MKREYKVIMLLILVISIVALVLTSSYALFSFEEKGKVENKLVTGVYSSCSYEDGTTWNFDYTGSEQTFTVPCDGEYKLETWGAQGGNSTIKNGTMYRGGNGSYSAGYMILNSNGSIYINIGGKGTDNTNVNNIGGYNGGGYSYNKGVTSGGGATHIALSSGLLSTLESNKSNILIVSGGGGGSSGDPEGGGYCYGGNAGGSIAADPIPGSDDYYIYNGKSYMHGIGGTQISGYKFGIGESGFSNVSEKGSGGGGGYYGGTSGNGTTWTDCAGGGSGYIGNSLLTDKIMYCYNCQESSEESTKTVSTTCTSQTPTENCSKQGNGYAKITLVKADKPIKKYTETILNGTDPVLKDNLVPIKIASDGTVSKADISKEWYKYENKEWANAVILKDETKTYNNGETIPEDNIESYFVWIPRYKYQIFDEGNYTSLTSIEDKTQTINVVFENKDTIPSNGTTKGSYLTHPAFTSFDSNGFWVGKFETGYDGATSTSAAQVNSVNTSKIIIKPNVYSWRGITLGKMFKNSYDYQRDLDSHMMKNTEWGAVAYLQHSIYGSQASVRINNNSAYITGYAATVEPTKGNSSSSIDGNRYESTSLGKDGTYTINYLNNEANVASTTGNKSGVYDMSGGAWEYTMGYTTGSSIGIGGSSGITSLYSNFFSNSTYTKYWDKYTATTVTQYNDRILGDATGEMGPFGSENDPDGVGRYKSSWYKDYASALGKYNPWYIRGGQRGIGDGSGIFTGSTNDGAAESYFTFRIILTP